MRAVVETAALLDAVNFVARVVDGRGLIPILANVCIICDDDGLLLSGTNLDTWGRARVAGTIDGGEGTCIDAALLRQFAAAAAKGSETEIAWEADKPVSLKAGRARATLGSLPIADFPQARQADVDMREIDAEAFGPALLAANLSASTEEVKFYLNGVCIAGGEVVATNGHKMHIVGLPGDGGRAIIPSADVLRIAALLKDGGRFGVASTSWKAGAGDRSLIGKTIDASFPDYERIIPPSKPVALFDRDAMLDAIKQVSVGLDRTRWVKIVGEGEAITLSHVGHADTSVRDVAAECPAEIKAPFSTGLNTKYLADALSIMPDAEVALSSAAPGDPMLLEPANGSAFQPRRAVLMPVRV